jgi:hypothetical protein
MSHKCSHLRTKTKFCDRKGRDGLCPYIASVVQHQTVSFYRRRPMRPALSLWRNIGPNKPPLLLLTIDIFGVGSIR